MTDLNISASGQQGKQTLTVEEPGPDMRPWTADTALAIVGTPNPRLEAFEKVTGRAQYSSDLRLPRQAYARVLRSSFPHARIKSVDASEAESMPGVYAVIHSGNVERIDWYDGSAVFDTTVRLIGDEVAAVAAESEEIAADALDCIRVTYEELPYVTDPDEALKPGAPELRPEAEGEGNIAGEPKVYERGDVTAALKSAEVVVDSTYTTQTALHNCLEPHGCTASWEGDHLTLWDSTQSIFTVRQMLATALGMPEGKVRVIKHHMGGGFGSKQIAWKQDVIAALLSREAGRPIQLMLDRESESLAVGNRPASRQHVRLGATQDGTLVAIDVDIHQSLGAYKTGGEASNVSGMYQTLYKCDNVRTVQTPIYTNAGPGVAFRAPGHVESAWALEQAIDELALKLRMDPIEFRLRNYSVTEQQVGKPYTLPEGLRLSYEKVRETAGWDGRSRDPGAGRFRKGTGFAAHDWVGGAGSDPGYAWIELNEEGTADVVTGTQDIGTGTRTGLAQVAAEELGLPLSDITFHLGDTGVGPYSPVSSGSATQATIGPAIMAAAYEVKAQLLQVAAAAMEMTADRLSVHDGKVMVDNDPARAKSVKDVMQEIAPVTLRAQGARMPNPKDKVARTFGSQIVDVEVDTWTGEVTVKRVVASHECGRVVNPTMVESQVIGAVTQGLGFALLEERVMDDRLGMVMNANLEDYTVPTIADIPEIINVPVDVPDPEANPTGAKGIGEPPLVPTAPAIANAIYDAVGIRVYDAPISRHRMLELLTERRATTGQEEFA
ncbi:MAG TPA: xanthine dehydrogenase family protein molybdopterin-binding subunit [Thermomicrobiales bacterium]|nr:xanthine dehydrogenase family protein molybdopterin-binding subunit [Thermomicrobiales bacterium]